jgi:hypothetical protein
MRASLETGGAPRFKSFWEAHRLCLPLFKQSMIVSKRALLWESYTQLSLEARRLKEMLDEQSAFNVEQIELAIKVLEDEIAISLSEPFEEVSADEIVFPKTLQSNQTAYFNLQRQINFLNIQANRVHGLRKELLITEMKIRTKNKFFQRLSALGDAIFPKRKELVTEISSLFSQDVSAFILTHFSSEPSKESLFYLRDEIKELQGLAKVFTLNTHAFTETRNQLSRCWDLLKEEEKDRKKEKAQQKILFKNNAKIIHLKIQETVDSLEGQKISFQEAAHQLESISSEMRKIELGRDEVKELRDRLGEIKKGLNDQLRAEEELRKKNEQERLRDKKEKFIRLKKQAEDLILHLNEKNIEDIESEQQSIVEELRSSFYTKTEKHEIENLIKPLKDLILEKKEQSLLSLSEDHLHRLQQLKTVLKQRLTRRTEVKDQLASLKKAACGSGFDFEKAMNLTQQISEENERLNRVNFGIKEIEAEIAILQSPN